MYTCIYIYIYIYIYMNMNIDCKYIVLNCCFKIVQSFLFV